MSLGKNVSVDGINSMKISFLPVALGRILRRADVGAVCCSDRKRRCCDAANMEASKSC